MKNKIAYFMSRDTRLILDNLTKVIKDENELLVSYTIIRRSFKDEKTVVVRYMKDTNTMIIYGKLKKYNSNIYEAFIEWAEDNGIKWYSIGELL